MLGQQIRETGVVQQSLGVDLASYGNPTGMCRVNWMSGRAVVEDLRVGVFDDDAITAEVSKVRAEGDGWVAIDAPFGYPLAFSKAVFAWLDDDPAKAVSTVRPLWLEDGNWDPITRRLTDAYVHTRLAPVKPLGDSSVTWPLSAVVERITATVIRCARLLTAIDRPVDRIGLGTPSTEATQVVETYPKAALMLWDISVVGYKRSAKDGGNDVRLALVDHIMDQCPWLHLGNDDAQKDEHRRRLELSDDAIDALVCALVARLTAHPDRPTAPGRDFTPGELGTVRREGWIHLPPPQGGSFDDLSRLAGLAF